MVISINYVDKLIYELEQLSNVLEYNLQQASVYQFLLIAHIDMIRKSREHV